MSSFNFKFNKIDFANQNDNYSTNNNLKLKNELSKSKQSNYSPDGKKFSFSINSTVNSKNTNNNRIHPNGFSPSSLNLESASRDNIMDSIIRQNKMLEDKNFNSKGTFLGKFNPEDKPEFDKLTLNKQKISYGETLLKTLSEENSDTYDKIIEENKITSKLNNEYKIMIQDLEEKLNDLLENKEWHKEAESNNPNLKYKIIAEKKEKQLEEATSKVEYYMNELYGFMSNMSKIRAHLDNIGQYYGKLNNFLDNLKNEFGGYIHKIKVIDSHEDIKSNNKIRTQLNNLVKEIDQLNIHIEEKQITIIDARENHKSLRTELDYLIKSVDYKDLEYVTKGSAFTNKFSGKYSENKEIMGCFNNIRSEIYNHFNSIDKLRNTYSKELASLTSNSLLKYDYVPREEFDAEIQQLNYYIKNITYEHLILLDNYINSKSNVDMNLKLTKSMSNDSKNIHMKTYNNNDKDRFTFSLESKHHSNISYRDLSPSQLKTNSITNVNIDTNSVNINNNDKNNVGRNEFNYEGDATPKSHLSTISKDLRIHDRVNEFRSIMSKYDKNYNLTNDKSINLTEVKYNNQEGEGYARVSNMFYK